MNHVFARLRVRLHGLIQEERGQDIVEFALLSMAVVLVVIATFPPFATILNSMFSSAASSI